MKVTVHRTAFHESKSILDIKVTLHLAPEVYVFADHITFDKGSFSDYNATLGLHLTLEGTIDTDVIRRDDLTLDNCAGRYSAD